MGLFDIFLNFGSNNSSAKNVSPLHEGVARSSIEELELLLDQTPTDINSSDKSGRTPLHWATTSKCAQKVDLFLNRGSNINIKDIFGKTPLHYSVVHKNITVLEILLENGADVDIVDNGGQSPLHLAVKLRFKTAIQKLLDKGTKINMQDNNGYSSLQIAVMQDFESICDLLLSRGAEINLKDKEGNSTLHWAVWINNKTIAKQLLDRGAKVNEKDGNEETPILILMKCLLLLRTNLETRFRTFSSMLGRQFSDAVCDRLDLTFFELTCELLLSRGAKVDISNKEGNSLLHLAVLARNRNITEQLLNKGVDIENKNAQGETPLHLAMTNYFEPVVKLLIDRGANVNIIGKDGNTPLHLVSLKGDILLVEKMLDKDVDIEHKNKDGQTALHVAAWNSEDGYVLRALAKKRAEVNVQDNMGRTPLHLAISNDKSESVKELLDWGCSMLIKDKSGVKTSNLVSPYTYTSAQVHRTVYKHFIKLKSVNFPFGHEFETDDIDLPFQKSCLEELDRMKIEKCGKNSLYDVFYKYNDPTFLENQEMESKINSSDLETQFPIYASFLKATYVRAKWRVYLLDMAQNSLNTPLPNEIVRKILSLLSNNDLKNLIEAHEDSKITQF